MLVIAGECVATVAVIKVREREREMKMLSKFYEYTFFILNSQRTIYFNSIIKKNINIYITLIVKIQLVFSLI